MPADMKNPDLEHPAHAFRGELPTYAAALAIGVDAEAVVPGMAAHLASCRVCAAELRELLELAWPAYAGALTPSEHYPAVDLAFLEPPMPVLQPSAPVWQLESGRLTIQFSHALLASMPKQPLAGAARGARGELIFRYTQEPLDDLDVSIEVYTEDPAQQQGRVRVGVDVAGRSPLEQHGSLVKLYLGEANWAAETDETGCADFVPVPLDNLPSLRVEITPLREIEN
jgi:hypothetical protein